MTPCFLLLLLLERLFGAADHSLIRLLLIWSRALQNPTERWRKISISILINKHFVCMFVNLAMLFDTAEE